MSTGSKQLKKLLKLPKDVPSNIVSLPPSLTSSQIIKADGKANNAEQKQSIERIQKDLQMDDS